MKYSIFLAALLLAACGQAKKPDQQSLDTADSSAAATASAKSDTVSYSVESIIKQSKYCSQDAKNDTSCTIVKMRFPKFGADQKTLNDSLSHWLSGGTNPDKSYSSPEAYATGFKGDYENYIKDQQVIPAAIPWELQVTVSVSGQHAGIVPMLVDFYAFMGGAHGSPASMYHNWDTKLQRELTLPDLLNANYADSLNSAAERIFRKQENLSPTFSLKQGYFFENGLFRLNDNFLITEQGLKFLYNPYEIKPYAAGKTELLIPYPAIASLIKKDGPLSRYPQK